MAFLGIRLPHDIARLFGQIDVPGKREPVDHMHITMLFLGDHVPVEQIGKAVVAAFNVTSRTQPFTVRVSKLTSFPQGDDGTPIICPVESPELHELRAKLAAAFDAAGVEYSKRFPEYRPHVTLSYAQTATDERPLSIIEWGVGEVVLWGGDSGDDAVVVSFPFALAPADKTAALYRLVVRVARFLRK